MTKWRRVLFLGLAIFLWIPGLHAQKRLTPRPPIYGIPAKTLPHGRWIFRGYWIRPEFNKKLDSATGDMVALPPGMSFTSDIWVAKIRYGLSDSFTAILNLPFVSKRLHIPNGVRKESAGVGDVVAAGLYKFYHNRARRLLVSGLIYSKFPTGRSTGLKPDELPLGTGSFDLGVALMPEKEIGRWDLRWAAFYISRGKNGDQVDLGDVVSLSWSAAYNASRRFIGEATLLYKAAGKNRLNGKALANTDMQLAQLILGAQYRLARTFLVQAALPVTLKEKRPFGAKLETWIGLYYLL